MDRSRRPSRPHQQNDLSYLGRRGSLMPDFTAPVSRRGSLAFAGRRGSVVHIGRRRSTLRQRATPAASTPAGAGHEPWISHAPEIFYPVMQDVDPDDPIAVHRAIHPPDLEAARRLLLKPIRNKKSRRAASKVARPPNAWIIYRSHVLSRLRQEGRGDILKVKQAILSKRAGVLWSSELHEIREYYQQLASIMDTSHKALHPDYRFQPRRADGQPYRAPKSPTRRKGKSKSSASQSGSRIVDSSNADPVAGPSSSSTTMDDASDSGSFHSPAFDALEPMYSTPLDQHLGPSSSSFSNGGGGDDDGGFVEEPVSPSALRALSQFSLSTPDRHGPTDPDLYPHDDFDAALQNYTFPAVDGMSGHGLGLSFDGPPAMPVYTFGQPSAPSTGPFFHYPQSVPVDPLLAHSFAQPAFAHPAPSYPPAAFSLTEELHRLQNSMSEPMSRLPSSLPSWSSSASEAPSSSLADPASWTMDQYLAPPGAVRQGQAWYPDPGRSELCAAVSSPAHSFSPPAVGPGPGPGPGPSSRQASPSGLSLSSIPFSFDEWPEEAFVSSSSFSTHSPGASDASSPMDVPIAAVVYPSGSPMSRSSSGLRYEV